MTAVVYDFQSEREKRAQVKEPTYGEMRRKIGGTFVGYQVGDETGYPIQGEPSDPTGLAGFEVLNEEAAETVRMRYPGIHLAAIYEGDVINPVIIGAQRATHIMNLYRR